ncbi:glycogen debranching enzyme N-terminal domain-containing protein [Porphyromonas pogonae]|uniref:glycogen debranching enzyme N-terminal domain-containing protein n=1 Tax=Porphyromonas pogonae TaxID=867595 RepID=UPI002E7A4FC4|nr:glycogen debranching enzyme N-terminal domain-containing protein [Porphyromonas pogonae]
MAYLKFDRKLLTNLDESMQLENLRTNRLGAYSNSSIVGCNTRKYHGLLVVPLPHISPHHHVLLSSMDITVIQHDTSFNLGVHQYQGGVISPQGHKYMKEFDMEVSSQMLYRVGGVLLKMETLFNRFAHQVILKYTLLEAHSPTKLQLRPFLAFRDVKLLTHKNSDIDESYEEIPGGIKVRLYDNYPHLHLQGTGKIRFHSEPYWYEGLEYVKERERGYEYVEDLYVPGYFEVNITKGEPVYLSASLEQIEPSELRFHYREEYESRIPRSNFKNCLINVSRQFYYRPAKDDAFIMAGYPWFGVRARDMMVALPGVTIHANYPERFTKVMSTFMPLIRDYMHQDAITSLVTHINDPDVPLWSIWSIQQYAKYAGVEEVRRTYATYIREVLEYYFSNIHPNTRVMNNGLLYTCGDELPHTWMDAKIDNHAVVKREGYLVELNCLWYNALMFYKELLPDEQDARVLETIDNINTHFCPVFLNQYNYLFDYVKEDSIQDWSVRPNMIFAVSFDYSPLTKHQQRSVMEIVTRELRTPKGLRSLSPKSEGFTPYCCGTQYQRELSYYNGSVWPWLLGAYIEGYLKIYGKGGVSYVERLLIGMEEELHMHGIGTLSELFDGNPPYKGRGAISFAMSVAEILRSISLIENVKKEARTFNPIIKYV